MKKGISLITLIITIVVIIILSAAVILTISNTGVIDNAKIASLASDQSNLQTSIELYLTNVVSSNLELDFDKEKILFGNFKDSYRIVKKDEDSLIEAVITKNNEEIYVYKLDEELCKGKGIEFPKTPSKDSYWYISKDGQVYLVYDEGAKIPNWIIGKPSDGKQIENEQLDIFVGKIGEWENQLEPEPVPEPEPSIHDTIPVASADMFTYYTNSDNTVLISGFNTAYSGTIPSEIKFPTIDPNGNTITGIYARAFDGDTVLSKIVISEGMTHLGNNAFDNCENLKEVYLPTTLATTFNGGSAPFYNCANIEKITVPNFIVSSSYYVPSDMFRNSKSTINTVKFIGEITSISGSAFNGFTALKNITIPDTVTSIGMQAFYNCTSLSGKLTIPENVTVIENSAFYNCSNIEEIEFLSKGKLKNISAYAFYNVNLITSVKVPEGVTTLGNNAFDRCESLKEVYLPTTLAATSNGSSAPFYNCAKIEKITVPNFIVSSSYYIPSDMFRNSKSTINTVKFIGEITSISGSAFNGFTALKNITIPDTVTSIGMQAFYNCTSLSGKLTIPANVTVIENSAFYNCSNIEEIEFLSKGKLKNISAYAFYNVNLITSIKVPEGVTTLGNNAFDRCENLKEVYLPTTLATTFNGGSAPFYNCTKIEKITIPNYIISNSYYVPSDIFRNSKSTINTVEFIGEITSISGSAFYDFTALKNITIPDTVTSIGMHAFYNCTSLSGKLTIPANVTVIENSAFYNCSNISEIEFSNQGNLKTISAWVFGNLKLIESVNIPSSVTTMQNDIFNGCTNLKTINYSGTATGSPWGAPNATIVGQ